MAAETLVSSIAWPPAAVDTPHKGASNAERDS